MTIDPHEFFKTDEERLGDRLKRFCEYLKSSNRSHLCRWISISRVMSWLKDAAPNEFKFPEEFEPVASLLEKDVPVFKNYFELSNIQSQVLLNVMKGVKYHPALGWNHYVPWDKEHFEGRNSSRELGILQKRRLVERCDDKFNPIENQFNKKTSYVFLTELGRNVAQLLESHPKGSDRELKKPKNNPLCQD